MSATASLPITPVAGAPERDRTAWGAVAAMMATSFVLVTAEFLPPSLLPAMAASLGVTEGQAGQTVTVTALAGLVTGPTIGILFPRLDRRVLLAALALAAVVSNVAVALTSSVVLLLVARLVLGAAIGGFWGMSLALAARLSAPSRLGRSMMMVNGGTMLATVAGVPLGIWLGSILDWRTVFVAIAIATALVAVLLRVALPSLPPLPGVGGFRGIGQVLATRGFVWGLGGHVLIVLAHFVAFSYIRSALALTPELGASGAAALVVVFGIGGVIGNFAIGALVDRWLAVLRIVVPLMFAIGIGALAVFPGNVPLIAVAVGVWGIAFGGWLGVLSTWMGRIVRDRMEPAGGLLVASFQLAIMLGAGVGGIVVDSLGVRVALVIAAGSAVVGGALFASAPGSARPRPTAS